MEGDFAVFDALSGIDLDAVLHRAHVVWAENNVLARSNHACGEECAPGFQMWFAKTYQYRRKNGSTHYHVCTPLCGMEKTHAYKHTKYIRRLSFENMAACPEGMSLHVCENPHISFPNSHSKYTRSTDPLIFHLERGEGYTCMATGIVLTDVIMRVEGNPFFPKRDDNGNMCDKVHVTSQWTPMWKMRRSGYGASNVATASKLISFMAKKPNRPFRSGKRDRSVLSPNALDFESPRAVTSPEVPLGERSVPIIASSDVFCDPPLLWDAGVWANAERECAKTGFFLPKNKSRRCSAAISVEQVITHREIRQFIGRSVYMLFGYDRRESDINAVVEGNMELQRFMAKIATDVCASSRKVVTLRDIMRRYNEYTGKRDILSLLPSLAMCTPYLTRRELFLLERRCFLLVIGFYHHVTTRIMPPPQASSPQRIAGRKSSQHRGYDLYTFPDFVAVALYFAIEGLRIPILPKRDTPNGQMSLLSCMSRAAQPSVAPMTPVVTPIEHMTCSAGRGGMSSMTPFLSSVGKGSTASSSMTFWAPDELLLRFIPNPQIIHTLIGTVHFTAIYSAVKRAFIVSTEAGGALQPLVFDVGKMVDPYVVSAEEPPWLKDVRFPSMKKARDPSHIGKKNTVLFYQKSDKYRR